MIVDKITLRRVSDSFEISIDSDQFSGYIPEGVDWGTIEGTHYTYKYPGQVGESLMSTSLGTRDDIKIVGWVVATTELEMTSLKKTLNSFINPQEPMEIIYQDYTLQFSPDSTVRYSVNISENNEVICKFQITGVAHDPLFRDSTENSLLFATTHEMFHFPLIISPDLDEGGVIFGARTDSLIADVVNKGDVSTGIRVVFRAKGTLTNPKLIKIDTQETISIQKVLVAGEEVEINTNIGSKYVIGRLSETSEYTNYFVYRTLSSKWLNLSPGKNSFRYDADDGIDNLEVFIYFQDKYLEVQKCC